jgi:hypothetical protein
MKTDTELHDEVLGQLNQLPPEQRERLLNLVNALASRRQSGTHGKDLVNVSGGFNLGDLELMSAAIDDSCERTGRNAP